MVDFSAKPVTLEQTLGTSLKSILIVDDEENTRLGLSKLLTQEGFHVDSAANGYDALNYLADHQVNLVISDINMPDMNGLSFLRELSQRFPNINVIMITAYGGVESYLEAMNLGAFEYLHKPVRLDELRSIMRKIFNGGSAVPQLS
ncbi:MAG: response regulator [Deltaproteobacteria bacterium]|jgi:DNA-binding NtrC family response regulator|nr:response regulator [Deltaproteobacteria bacterium]MBW2503126.1 response regulator [Deltaproteobacteria bacterium]MBW2520806.1 response regulator [Deltaproteobacteria bacterium]